MSGEITHVPKGNKLSPAEYDGSNTHLIGGEANLKIVRTATYVVAASDAPSQVQAQADYVCDGTADEVEIKAAILATAPTSGLVHLSTGNFYISSKMELSALATSPHKVIIEGEGKGTKIISGGNFNIFNNNGNDYTQFRDMYFYGNGGSNSNDIGIEVLSGSTDIIIKNCYFENFYKGVEGNTATRFNVLDCYTTANANMGIYFYQCVDSHMSRIYSIGDATSGVAYSLGVQGSSTYRVTIDDCKALNSYGWGVGVVSAVGVRVTNVDVTLAATAVGGIEFLTNATDGLISDCTVLGVATTANQMGIAVTEGSDRIQISNTTVSSLDRPIWIDDVDYAYILSPNITGNGSDGETWNAGIHLYKDCNYCTIAGGVVRNSNDAGITIGGTSGHRCDYNTVVNVTILDDQTPKTQEYCIKANTAYTNYNILINNKVRSYGTAPFILYAGYQNVVRGNDGYVHSGEIRSVSNTLAAGNANAIGFAWHNPETQDISIKKVVLEITTGGGTVGSHLDVGIADDAAGTNGGTEFFDDLLLNTVQIDDSWVAGDGGTQTKWITCQDSASATDGWIAGQILDANAASLVGKYYIEYEGR